MSYCSSKNGSLLLSAPTMQIYILSAWSTTCYEETESLTQLHSTRVFSFRALSIHPSIHPTVQPLYRITGRFKGYPR
jgi:hypothetical protein